MHDLKQMKSDIIKAAQAVHAPYSEETIQHTFDTFSGFNRGAIQFRTTNKPEDHRRLDVRYEEIGSTERPIDIAHRAGLIPDNDEPVNKLLLQVYDEFPYVGDGVDFDAKDGFTKLWFFPKGKIQVERLFSLPAMPSSVSENASFYDKHLLDEVYILGIDYRARSMNIYMQLTKSEQHTHNAITNMIQDLGFVVPNEQVIEYSLPAISVALTFRWDSPSIERICFFVVHENAAKTPRNIDPIANSFLDGAPQLGDSIYQLSWTFHTQGAYLKVENDYTANLMATVGAAIL